MDSISLAAGFAVGTLIGAGLCWVVMRARSARDIAEATARPVAEVAAARARLEESSKRVAQLERDLQHRERTLDATQREATALNQAHARVAAELDGERKAAADKLALLEQADVKLREAFTTLSTEALRRNSESFLELANASLGTFQKQATLDLEHRHSRFNDLVKPLHESLSKVDTKLHEVEKERAGSHATLTEQIRSLLGTTTNLEKALRTPNVRGGWGEIQLRRVVEMAGMLEHCHFNEKEIAVSDDGRLVPDLVIKLPGGKHVIVDAKVPYIAYREAVEAEDEAVREARLRDHAKQVREHMAQLSSKSYWSQFQPAPEFVFMFLPGEGYFSAALRHDPGLIEFGVARQVIPASPLTLIALLRAVAYGWQQERIAENAQAISNLGRELYDRVRRLADSFAELAKGLNRSVKAYNEAIGTLETRVLVTARRFKELGITAAEPISELQPLDRTPRALQAPELADLFGSEVLESETVPDDGED